MHQSLQDPRFLFAQNLHDQNRLADAIAYLKQQLKEQPRYFQGWLLLSRYLYDAGYFPEAIQVVQKAEAFDPLQSQFKEIQIAMQRGDLNLVEKKAKEMQEKEIGHPRATFTLAQIAELKKDFKRKVNILREGLIYSPANIFFRQQLVNALEAYGDYAGAIEAAEKLVSLLGAPDSYWTLLNVLLRYGQNKKVLANCSKAENVCAGVRHQLSEILRIRGQSERILGHRSEAIASLHKSLEHNPGNTLSWWALADMKNYTFSPEEEDVMQSLLENKKLPANEQAVVAFAFASASESRGDWQQAISLYHRANKLKNNPRFRSQSVTEDFSRIINAYTPANLGIQANKSGSGPVPVFIVGLPRSGSTLIEQIIASHSQIEGTMEQPVLSSIARQASEMCHSLFGNAEIEKIGSLTNQQLADLGHAYVTNGALFRSDTLPFFTDKLPFNFRHIGLIHKIFPRAIIIDARRNPMDCGLSLYKQFFSNGVEFSYDLGNIGDFYNSYLMMMDHWDEVLPGKVLTVQYEELINYPEKITRMILEHIGVEFESSCLSFYNTKREIHTASSEQVRQPINKRGIGVWKNVEEELEPLKKHLGDRTLDRFRQWL